MVHHSSRKFNLTTALRQPWTSAHRLAVLRAARSPSACTRPRSPSAPRPTSSTSSGSTPSGSTSCPAPFEYVFNTPSHHRVHHASQGGYLDRNFGGILIVWDRLFGSFVAETERPVYGLTKNIDTYNPLRVATHEYVAIAKDVKGGGQLARAGRAGLPADPAGSPRAPVPSAAEHNADRLDHGNRAVA